MSMTDPIADLLTRVRNAASAGHRSVDIPASKLKREISRVLAEERFIDNFAYYDDGTPFVLAFIGDTWTEAELLAYAYDFEEATKARIPPSLVPRPTQ